MSLTTQHAQPGGQILAHLSQRIKMNVLNEAEQKETALCLRPSSHHLLDMINIIFISKILRHQLEWTQTVKFTRVHSSSNYEISSTCSNETK